ncbi:MAG: MBL fold metallo-hydrolase [Thermoleophilia bacterium]
MNEILPGVFHWVTMHDRINMPVSSYYLDGPEGAVVIDPRVPDEGVEWFAGRNRPEHVFLTNRHHYRHSGEFVKAFGCRVWCHRDGLHEFTHGEEVTAFEPGRLLPGCVEVVEVGSICLDETALYIPWAQSMSFADGLVRAGFDGPLGFVPDFLMGDDPEAVKRGLYAAFERLLERDFDHLLLAHGGPWVGGGREALRTFVGSRPKD